MQLWCMMMKVLDSCHCVYYREHEDVLLGGVCSGNTVMENTVIEITVMENVVREGFTAKVHAQSAL